MAHSKEDADDVRAYDEAKRRLASGEDELIPAEYANRILDGESPVRVWREYRGLSGRDLAEQAGISAAELERIERGGRRRGEVMERIAQALGIEGEDLA